MTLADLPAVAALSNEEKLALADELYVAVGATGLPPLTEEQRAELDRRRAAYEADPSTGRTMEEVKARCEAWKVHRDA